MNASPVVRHAPTAASNLSLRKKVGLALPDYCESADAKGCVCSLGTAVARNHKPFSRRDNSAVVRGQELKLSTRTGIVRFEGTAPTGGSQEPYHQRRLPLFCLMMSREPDR